jgi:hypothetical protein
VSVTALCRHLISTGYLSLESREAAAAIACALEAWIYVEINRNFLAEADYARYWSLRRSGANRQKDPSRAKTVWVWASRLQTTDGNALPNRVADPSAAG